MVGVDYNIAVWHLFMVSGTSSSLDGESYHSSHREVGALLMRFSILEDPVKGEYTRGDEIVRLQ